MTSQKGFTLIELLVVIAIIALLLSVVMPALGMAKEHAKRITCSVNMESIGQATFSYAMNNKEYIMPSFANENNMHVPATYYAYYINTGQSYTAEQIFNLEHVKAGPFNLAWLYESGFIDLPKVFYCPSAPKKPTDSTQVHHYDAYHDPYPWPWNNDYTGSGFNLDKVRTSYNYLPQNGRKKDSYGFSVTAKKTSELSAGSTLVVDLLVDLDHLAHKKGAGKSAGGVNALLSDGSVDYCNDSEAFDPQYWKPRPNGDWKNFRTILSLLK